MRSSKCVSSIGIIRLLRGSELPADPNQKDENAELRMQSGKSEVESDNYRQTIAAAFIAAPR